jgi:hypothetical protein
MNLLFYATTADGVGGKLEKVIEEVVPEEKIEVCRTVDSLSRRLREPTYDLSVAVLLAETKEDLLCLVSNKELIWNLRVILVLPDGEDDTVTKGHLLRPRYLTYADSDFSDVATVLSKMLQTCYTNNRKGNHLETILNSRRALEAYRRSSGVCFRPRKG